MRAINDNQSDYTHKRKEFNQLFFNAIDVGWRTMCLPNFNHLNIVVMTNIVERRV